VFAPIRVGCDFYRAEARTSDGGKRHLRFEGCDSAAVVSASVSPDSQAPACPPSGRPRLVQHYGLLSRYKRPRAASGLSRTSPGLNGDIYVDGQARSSYFTEVLMRFASGGGGAIFIGAWLPGWSKRSVRQRFMLLIRRTQRSTTRRRPLSQQEAGDKSVAGSVVLGRCHQHPTATIYEEAVQAYGNMRALAVPLASEPAKLPPPSDGRLGFGSSDLSRPLVPAWVSGSQKLPIWLSLLSAHAATRWKVECRRPEGCRLPPSIEARHG
jgi:hypothetical protein